MTKLYCVDIYAVFNIEKYIEADSEEEAISQFKKYLYHGMHSQLPTGINYVEEDSDIRIEEVEEE